MTNIPNPNPYGNIISISQSANMSPALTALTDTQYVLCWNYNKNCWQVWATPDTPVIVVPSEELEESSKGKK